jgi:DNA end-binding protein Ku
LLEIHAFVDTDDIDPIYFNKTYFLGPGREETKKAYACCGRRCRAGQAVSARAAPGPPAGRRDERAVEAV